MPTTARGVVLRAFNEPLTLEEAPVLDPEPGAIVARVDLAGICGTDVHLHHGNLPIPTPVILGHEAVGRVEKLGDGVTADFNGEPLREGDAIAWASSRTVGSPSLSPFAAVTLGIATTRARPSQSRTWSIGRKPGNRQGMPPSVASPLSSASSGPPPSITSSKTTPDRWSSRAASMR